MSARAIIAERKRRVGYQEPYYVETCASCGNIIRRGTHLRCARHDFAVVADGICRNGWMPQEPKEEPPKPSTAKDTPLPIGYDPAVGAGETAQVVVDVAVDAQNAEEVAQ